MIEGYRTDIVYSRVNDTYGIEVYVEEILDKGKSMYGFSTVMDADAWCVAMEAVWNGLDDYIDESAKTIEPPKPKPVVKRIRRLKI